MSEKQSQDWMSATCRYLEKRRDWKTECVNSTPKGRERIGGGGLEDKNIYEE